MFSLFISTRYLFLLSEMPFYIFLILNIEMYTCRVEPELCEWGIVELIDFPPDRNPLPVLLVTLIFFFISFL